VPHVPQLTKAPFTFSIPQSEGKHGYAITTVDAAGRTAKTDVLEA
jgi:hypothetical protein